MNPVTYRHSLPRLVAVRIAGHERTEEASPFLEDRRCMAGRRCRLGNQPAPRFDLRYPLSVVDSIRFCWFLHLPRGRTESAAHFRWCRSRVPKVERKAFRARYAVGVGRSIPGDWAMRRSWSGLFLRVGMGHLALALKPHYVAISDVASRPGGIMTRRLPPPPPQSPIPSGRGSRFANWCGSGVSGSAAGMPSGYRGRVAE